MVIGEAGLRLRIKYKLRTAPSDAEAAEWAALAQQYIDRGGDPEDAGRRAADELFEIVPDLMLKSQADTIEALLDRAKTM